MLLKYTAVAMLLGGVLTSVPALAYQANPGLEAAEASAKFVPNLAEASPADWAADEDHEFIQRLNTLSKALLEFAAAYKSGRIDLKEVKALRKALRKALHELEKSEWFRPEKTK
jgi:hypothetical protein